ncbi:MAG: hypothetical protein ACRCZT_00355 [Plesiomonas sp.]
MSNQQQSHHHGSQFIFRPSFNKLIAFIMFIVSVFMFYHSGKMVFSHTMLTSDELTDTWDYGLLGGAFLLLGVMFWKRVFI